MNVMRDAQIWDQNNVHCAHKCAYVVRTLYLCTVEFQRDDCMTMQMFVDALPRLAINSKYIDQFDCDFVQSQCDCWL